MGRSFAPLALCDRAYAFLLARGVASEEQLLAHVYGGAAPAAVREQLAAPLANDARLERRGDGTWGVRAAPAQGPAPVMAFTALAVASSGPSPARSRLVRIAALQVEAGRVLASFDALLNPRVRVPGYVLQRIGVETEVLEDRTYFEDVYEELVRFLGERPVLAQDVRLAWAFVDAEARRIDRIAIQPELIDLNRLATQFLPLKGKPTLGAVAAHLGISAVDLKRPDEEARVLALVGARLLAEGSVTSDAGGGPGALRRAATARALPDEPGVYVMRDADQAPLYVGKARRLRSRVGAYVHRPLGATRRLEGLVGEVEAVDTSQCDTDVEALVLEDREIRRLQPRFNTVRQQGQPRYWIKLPAQRVSTRGRATVPPRLELSLGPGDGEGEFAGPFRNEAAAEQVRRLAREVFQLEELRRSSDVFLYRQRVQQAWRFVLGDSGVAEMLARRQASLSRRVAALNVGSLLLPMDPRTSRYAVLRPTSTGLEGFLLERAIVRSWSVLEDEDVTAFRQRLLHGGRPRTTADDTTVVLRWFGAQRSPARLVYLPDDTLAAADAIDVAALELLEARAAGSQHAIDALGEALSGCG